MIEQAIAADPMLSAMSRFDAPLVDPEKLLKIHDEAEIESVQRACRRAAESNEDIWLDSDTWVTADSLDAALRAAGGAMAATRRVLDGSCQTAFSICRPPGHHATRVRAMGFCLFNNVAAAAQTALDYGMERVAIVDFDVHHGNGTQDIFYDRSDVLFLSAHQYPLYPGTGAAGERGKGDGEGFTVNAPMTAGGGEDEYLQVFDDLFAPAIDDFHPELILVSAGFDAHVDDPLAGMRLTAPSYGVLAARIRAWAESHAQGRSVWVLEGGYSLAALAASVVEALHRLCA